MTDAPSRRTAEACEPCRRKKSRCSGEKPTCGHCARLGYVCSYASQTPGRGTRPHAHTASSRHRGASVLLQGQSLTGSRTGARLDALEAGLAQVQSLFHQQKQTRQSPTATPHSTSEQSTQPGQSLLPDSRATTGLPPWHVVEAAADVYMKFCNFQPLPLFSSTGWKSLSPSWDTELLLCIVASALRFPNEVHIASDSLSADERQYTAIAQKLVMQRVSHGPVNISTIQCLCILSLNEFNDGYTARASAFSSLAMDLAQSGGLASEHDKSWPEDAYEERRMCFWSVSLLKSLHGNWAGSSSFLSYDYTPKFPQSPDIPERRNTAPSDPEYALSASNDTATSDRSGIISCAIQMGELWSQTVRYARCRRQRPEPACWAQTSEYSRIHAQLMEFETKMPTKYRYRAVRFSGQESASVQQNRAFWAPWLLTQFLYHNILCLLNHPLILSLRLRNFGVSVVPEVFLRQTDDLIKTHTSWTIILIDAMNTKSFRPTDPSLAYCVSVVATIFLQQSYTENEDTRASKKENFKKCLDFIRHLATYWPRVSEMADKVEEFAEVVSASCHNSASTNTGTEGSVVIDLTLFWAIIESCFISELPTSSESYFGPTLTRHRPTFNFSEVLEDNLLPTPTDISAYRATSHTTARNPTTTAVVAAEAAAAVAFDPISPQHADPMLMPLDDQFSVLAQSYFAQGRDFSNVDDWWYSH